MVKHTISNKNDFLREQVKLLKVQQNISYKEFVEFIDFNYSTFYSWLRGAFNYSEEKLEDIECLLLSIKEGLYE